MSITPFKALINNTRSDYVYMSTTGDDNNTGEADSPVKSLKRALEIASVNGRGVFVKSGTYDLQNDFNDTTLTTYYYSSLGTSKTHQGKFYSDSDLESKLALKPPVIGELTLYNNYKFSTPNYSFTKTIDPSYSYTSILISNVNFVVDELKGKVLVVNESSNNSPQHSYRIIKNTADTIYVTGILSTITSLGIYDCPTIQIPSGKAVYFDMLKFAVCNLNFQIFGDLYFFGDVNVYGCYFFASTTKSLRMFSMYNGVKPYFLQCLLIMYTLPPQGNWDLVY